MLDVLEAMLLLMKTLLNMAEEHKDTVIPGYTHHSQQAQPVTLGHFYTSAFQAFSRDAERLLEAYKRVNLSTMGGAAIATTSFPISRERTAELLGFDGYLLNSMDATAALDFAYEPASVMAIFINNVGRVIESMLLWNLNEVGKAGPQILFLQHNNAAEAQPCIARDPEIFRRMDLRSPLHHVQHHESLSAGQRTRTRLRGQSLLRDCGKN